MGYKQMPLIAPQLAQEYQQGATVAELSERHQIAEETVRRWLKRYGTPLRPRGQPVGKYLPNGGQTRDKSGYILVLRPSHPQANSAGYVREHRLVMEQIIGRPLLPSEVVHHRNGQKDDNRPENLELCQTQADHKRGELTGNQYSRGKGNKAGQVFRTPGQMLDSIRELAAAKDGLIYRADLKPPYVSYRALNRAFGSWRTAVEAALQSPPRPPGL